MSLFGVKEKKEIERLKAQMMPEQITLAELQEKIENAEKYLSEIQFQTASEQKRLAELKKDYIETEDAIMFQSFGLYKPKFDFASSDEYKESLAGTRAAQKDMIKRKTAVTGSTTWTVNGSEAQGRKMVADMQKLLLRAFNAECDDIIEHVTYANYASSEKRIISSQEAISKLGKMMNISISPLYASSKMMELDLAFEYKQKKQAEKEAQKEARAEMREAAKLAKELEAARKKLEKEQNHYQNALAKVSAQLAKATDEDRAAIEAKKAEIEGQLTKIGAEFEAVDYREANQKAGYVYIISNIGAFGENVFKIGMTRRLDPMERIDELGDASVPFDFDVHAMIFSKDAPKLEAALHNAFADRKLNFVNQRREFFNVTLDEIKAVVKKNFDDSVEFTEIAPAEQYRQSLLMKKQ